MASPARRDAVVSKSDAAAEQDLAERFYAEALSEAERADFPEALGVEGVDEEIALLRLRLREALRQRPEDLVLMFKGLDLLMKIVAARYRLPLTAQKELTRATERTARGLGLDPAGEGDE